MRTHSVSNNNQILHGDQTLCEANYYVNDDVRSVCDSYLLVYLTCFVFTTPHVAHVIVHSSTTVDLEIWFY